LTSSTKDQSHSDVFEKFRDDQTFDEFCANDLPSIFNEDDERYACTLEQAPDWPEPPSPVPDFRELYAFLSYWMRCIGT